MKREKGATLLGLMAIIGLSGCGGGGNTLGPAGSTTGGQEQTLTFGSLVTRVSGTFQPPVTIGGYGVVVTGLAGGTISNLLINDSTPTLAETRIAFERNNNLLLTSPDGTTVTPFTAFPAAYPTHLSWSPDGNYFAFTSASTRIQRVTRDGIGVVTMTAGPTDYNPVWISLLLLAYEKYNAATNKSQIYTVSSSGAGATNISNSTTSDSRPSFSPLFQKIAYQRSDGSGNQIWTMNTNGTNQTNISGTNTDDAWPAWSPAGNVIAFASGGSIWTMSGSGDARTPLTTPPAGYTDTMPSWSPDGAQIAFTRQGPTGSQTYVMYADGSNPHNISNNGFSEVAPSWSPFFSSRKLIGTGGSLGTSTTGLLFGRNGDNITAVLTFRATTPSSAIVSAQTGSETSMPNVVFAISGDNLEAIGYVNGNDVPVNIPLGGTATNALVDFNTSTGRIADVLPYAASRAASKPNIVTESGVRVLRGNFLGVYDNKGKNRAPAGAHTIRLDGHSGEILSIE